MTSLIVVQLFNSSYGWTLVGPQWVAGDYYSKNLPNFAAIITFIQLHTWHQRGYSVLYRMHCTGSRYFRFCIKSLGQANRISKLIRCRGDYSITMSMLTKLPLHFCHICCLGFINVVYSSLGLSQLLQIYCPIFSHFNVFQDPFSRVSSGFSSSDVSKD